MLFPPSLCWQNFHWSPPVAASTLKVEPSEPKEGTGRAAAGRKTPTTCQSVPRLCAHQHCGEGGAKYGLSMGPNRSWWNREKIGTLFFGGTNLSRFGMLECQRRLVRETDLNCSFCFHFWIIFGVKAHFSLGWLLSGLLLGGDLSRSSIIWLQQIHGFCPLILPKSYPRSRSSAACWRNWSRRSCVHRWHWWPQRIEQMLCWDAEAIGDC